MRGARRRLAAAALALAGALPAVAGAQLPRGAPAVGDEEADWATTLEISIGGGRDRITPDLPPSNGGIAAGFAFLVRRNWVTVGAHFEGAGGDRTDSGYYGLGAGGTFRLAPWATLAAVLEAGGHSAGVESLYAGVPGGMAHLPYLGLRLGVNTLLELERSPALLWAGAAGIGLRVNFRFDLRRSTVTLPAPPGSGYAPEVFTLGGYHLSLVLVLPLEW